MVRVVDGARGVAEGPARVWRADGADARPYLATVRALYAEVFAAPPYGEGRAEVADFAARWDHRCAHPGFALALATTGGARPVGFALGYALTAHTTFWDAAWIDLPQGFTDERAGRTYAVVELAVRAAHRRRGWARALHDALLAGRGERRTVLLCRPDARAAQSAYASWGYRRAGRVLPAPDEPLYDVMTRPLAPRP